jgi:protein-S-isoprenylcysteine O-methyltransferase Ste14
MKASAIEFRLRMVIMVIIVAIGFWSPWIAGSREARIPLLEWLPLELSRLGLLSFAEAVPMVIVLGAVAALVGAIFRVWGAAWLGPGTVFNPDMLAGGVMVDGPYRYMRNPLYVGLWFMLAGLAMLMPPTGALFVLVVTPLFLIRLILGEEAFLEGKLGEPYREFLRSVPRVIPRLHASLPRTGSKPRWGIALLSELNPIVVFVALSALSWRFDYGLMLRGILVGFGISLVARGFVVGLKREPSPQG